MGASSGSAAEQVGLLQYTIGTASSTPLAGTATRINRFQKALVIFHLGDMASETIDCIVETCDSGGSNNATLKSATQLSAHATNNDSKDILIGVDASEMIASGKEYIRGKITTGGATGGTCAIIVLGMDAKYGPAGGFDAASVVEVKP
jgi:hypothetical protein